jgi:hypothetical protein
MSLHPIPASLCESSLLHRTRAMLGHPSSTRRSDGVMKDGHTLPFFEPEVVLYHADCPDGFGAGQPMPFATVARQIE